MCALKSVTSSDLDLSMESALRSVASKHGLRYVFLFGSRAREGVGRD